MQVFIKNPVNMFHHIMQMANYDRLLKTIWGIYCLMTLYLAAITPVHGFPTEGYITGMGVLETWDFANRPITVPYVYKLLFNDIDVIELGQYLIAIGSWTVLAYAMTQIMNTHWLKIVAFTVILMFSISREIYIWNSMILAESLSHSLMAAVIGAGILLAQWHDVNHAQVSTGHQFKVSFSMLFLLFFWSMTRDPNSYVLLGVAGMLSLWLLWVLAIGDKHKSYFLLPMMVILGSVFIFLIQLDSASRGQRWHIPFMNVLGERILTDAEHTQFFVEHGMPINDRVMQYAGYRAWHFQPDHDLRFEIGDWMAASGRQAYAEFLLSRPVDNLLAPIREWAELLSYEYSLTFLVEMYDNDDFPLWHRVMSCLAFPDDILACGVTVNHARDFSDGAFAFPVLLLVVPLLLMLLSFYLVGWDQRQWLPLGLLVSAYILAFIVWHGDADSVSRHAVQVNILYRMAGWIIALLAIDHLWQGRAVNRHYLDSIHHEGTNPN